MKIRQAKKIMKEFYRQFNELADGHRITGPRHREATFDRALALIPYRKRRATQ